MGDGKLEMMVVKLFKGVQMKYNPALIDPVKTVILFALLLVIGLVTRFPAWQFPHLFALHGVLAAPFFSALAMWHFNRKGSVWTLFMAVLLLAVFLGIMSLVMGLGFLFLASLLLVVYALPGKGDVSRRHVGCAVAFGALEYPCALVAGIAFGSYAPSFESLPTIGVLTLLALALALLGALPLAKTKQRD